MSVKPAGTNSTPVTNSRMVRPRETLAMNIPTNGDHESHHPQYSNVQPQPVARLGFIRVKVKKFYSPVQKDNRPYFPQMTSAEARLVPDTGPAPAAARQAQIELRQDTYSLVRAGHHRNRR